MPTKPPRPDTQEVTAHASALLVYRGTDGTEVRLDIRISVLIVVSTSFLLLYLGA